MPFDSVVVVIAVVIPFVIFAASLAWADYQTRSSNNQRG